MNSYDLRFGSYFVAQETFEEVLTGQMDNVYPQVSVGQIVFLPFWFFLVCLQQVLTFQIV